MKRMKKLFAILMTMAMVMGLSITGFAADGTQQISVNGLATTGENTVTYYKILEPDVTTSSGYKIVEGVTIAGYTTAEEFLAASKTEQQAALANNSSVLGSPNNMIVSDTTASASVTAGYYAIEIENSSDAGEPVVIYNNPMIVSVEYTTATEKDNGYEYNAVVDDDNSVTAKYTTIPVTKDATSSDEADDVTELGRTVEYTITTYIPSEAEKFILTDTLTGAEYNQNSVVITVGGESISTEGIVDFTTNPGSMIITLTSQLSGNAGKKVVITYDATVTDDYVNNTVLPNDGKHDYEENIGTTLKTGAISLLKKGDDANALNGAKFVVYKENPDGYVYLKRVVEDGKVSYTWVTKANATRFETGVDGAVENDGKIVIEGLDMGTYYFEEVEAPSGYSINTATPSVLIDEDNLTSNAEISATPAGTEMTDTKLSALPSTGGIGTTLFTIAGCVIMISAAGLFFATRKKAN